MSTTFLVSREPLWRESYRDCAGSRPMALRRQDGHSGSERECALDAGTICGPRRSDVQSAARRLWRGHLCARRADDCVIRRRGLMDAYRMPETSKRVKVGK